MLYVSYLLILRYMFCVICYINDMSFFTKRNTLLLAGAILIIGGSFLFVQWKNRKEVYSNTTDQLVVNDISQNALAKDDDGDGLANWEETLWKTDANNPDSDGDGTSDGEEIKAGRDPVIAGPNDTLSQEEVENKINKENEANLTETDKFSRDFFIQYVASLQSGQPVNQADYEKLLQNYLAEAANKTNVRFYGASDFKVATAETPTIIRAYGNEVARIMSRKEGAPALESELLIIDRYVKTTDPEELLKLEPLVAEYRRIEEELKNTPVPQSALILHIELINAISFTKQGIEGMQMIETDPLKAIAAINNYPEASGNILPALRLIKKYLVEEHKVVFTQAEDGYRLFNAL